MTIAQQGIYRIHNTVTGKCYVGQSAHLATRKSQHFNSLEKNKHHCQHLQRSFNKYGKEVFEFNVLEECTSSELVIKEQFWIDAHAQTGVYNIALVAGSPLGIKRSDETKLKMSVARTGTTLTEETKQKMRISQAAAKEVKSAKASVHWEQPGVKEAASLNRTGRTVSDLTKSKLADVMHERWADPDYKEKLSRSFKTAQSRVAGATSNRMKEKWKDPEFVAAMMAARQAARLRKAAKL